MLLFLQFLTFERKHVQTKVQYLFRRRQAKKSVGRVRLRTRFMCFSRWAHDHFQLHITPVISATCVLEIMKGQYILQCTVWKVVQVNNLIIIKIIKKQPNTKKGTFSLWILENMHIFHDNFFFFSFRTKLVFPLQGKQALATSCEEEVKFMLS